MLHPVGQRVELPAARLRVGKVLNSDLSAADTTNTGFASGAAAAPTGPARFLHLDRLQL